MSLQIDGVWKGKVWAPTVWAQGVWSEGGTPPAPPAIVVSAPVGGGYVTDRGRTKKEIRKDRERFGIPDEERLIAEALVEQIAARQVETLERDKQKQFDELQRELQVRGIQWQARYLEMLNAERERLINAELAIIFQQQQDEETMLLMLAMCV